jgi:hypothetical protein
MENPSSTIVRVYGFYRDMANIYEQQLPATIVSIELVSILYKLPAPAIRHAPFVVCKP